MADESYTVEDVELLVGWLPVHPDTGETITRWTNHVDQQHSSAEWGEPEELARRILAALAAAGRLVPAGAELRTEWAVRVDEPHPARKERQGTVITRWTREMVVRAPSVWAGWTPLRRTTIRTPWQPVTDTEETTDA